MTEVMHPETGELVTITDEEMAAQMAPDDDEPEPEPEPDEPEQGDEQLRQAKATTERELEKALQSLTKEADRHAERVRQIMGDDAEGLVPCELCWEHAPGFRWNRSPDPETVAAVRVVIGMPDLSNYRPSATERICDDCGGLGKVRTGSVVPQFETATCDGCAGKGFTPSRPRLNEDTAPVAPVAPENGAALVHDDGIQRDMFGTPFTDPDFGKMPNMRARPVDYWQTHRE